MMVPKKSLFFAGATLLCMSSAFAQSAQSKKARRVSNKVMNTVGVDLQTGVITRGPAIKQKAGGIAGATTALSVNNLDFGGFIGIDSGQNGLNGPCEWYSSVLKGSGNTGGFSTYVSNVIFAYCGIAKDVASGGVEGTKVTFNFWDGFTNGSGSTAGSQGTNVGSVTVTGLPGHTGDTAWFINGFAVCVVNLVNLNVGGGTPICLPDSNVAISYLFDDVDTLGVFGNTSTFLSCTTSCSAAPFLPNNVLDGTGMNDYIDNYCGGSFLTSFSFVTGTFFTVSFTSLSFGLGEISVLDSSDCDILDNGPGGICNTSTIANATNPFLGGGAWNQDVDCGTIPGSLTVTFTAFAPLAPPVACNMDKTGTFLVQTNKAFRALTGLGFRTTGSPVTITATPGVPDDCMFLGFTLYTQAYCANNALVPAGQTRLTNSVTTVVGTQE